MCLSRKYAYLEYYFVLQLSYKQMALLTVLPSIISHLSHLILSDFFPKGPSLVPNQRLEYLVIWGTVRAKHSHMYMCLE